MLETVLTRIMGLGIFALMCIATHAPALQLLPVQKFEGPLQNGGVLRLRDGVVLGSDASALGADVIYSHRCDLQGYYLQIAAGVTYLDEGRLPSPSSPDAWYSKPGCATSYRISGFELAYCTDLPNEQIVIDWFERYPGCAPSSALPVATYVLSGLPGSATPGSTSCWIVQVDLTGLAVPPLVLLADADGTYQGGGPINDDFGVRLAFPLSQGNSGPVFGNYAGNCVRGGGTIWDSNGYDPAAPGIGMGTISQFYREGGPAPGCYVVDGSPDYSFYLRIFSDACPILGPGEGFCSGDGTATPCPCGNIGQSYNGCPNSVTAAGARLTATGNPSLAQDTLVLQGSSMTNGTVLYFQGTSRMNGGLGTVFGDGLRCAGGSLIRLGATTNVGGASVFPAAGQPAIHIQGQIASPGTRTYQTWYRNVANYCTSAPFNLSNGYEIGWLP